MRVDVTHCYWADPIIRVVFSTNASSFDVVTTEAQLRFLRLLLRVSAVNISTKYVSVLAPRSVRHSQLFLILASLAFRVLAVFQCAFTLCGLDLHPELPVI